jgi:hypothetical protein
MGTIDTVKNTVSWRGANPIKLTRSRTIKFNPDTVTEKTVSICSLEEVDTVGSDSYGT